MLPENNTKKMRILLGPPKLKSSYQDLPLDVGSDSGGSDPKSKLEDTNQSLQGGNLTQAWFSPKKQI